MFTNDLTRVILVSSDESSIEVAHSAEDIAEGLTEFFTFESPKLAKKLRGAEEGDIIGINVDYRSWGGSGYVVERIERYTGTVAERLDKQAAALEILAEQLRRLGATIPELDLGTVR